MSLTWPETSDEIGIQDIVGGIKVFFDGEAIATLQGTSSTDCLTKVSQSLVEQRK